MLKILLASVGVLALAPAWSAPTIVPMKDKGADTYYVDVHVEGIGRGDYLVDTGAGYMTINEDMLAVLQANDKATYIRRLRGVLADGRMLIVPVYRIGSITIGDNCTIHDVEAAVFPGSARSLLGLSALRKAAPFMFSTEPPELQMSNCLDPALREARDDETEQRDEPTASLPMNIVRAESEPAP